MSDAVRPLRAGLPMPVGPSAWELPDPRTADEEGFVGFGADLAVETLVDAYRHGIFPWPHEGLPLPWFSPDPRAVIEAGSAHVSRSLRRHLHSSAWETTVDSGFAAVVAACAHRPGDERTWITPAMADAYLALHARGWAHSVEVWDGDQLVGGVYGVGVGACFTGESMFHRAADASKVALIDLAVRWAEAGGEMIDVQLATPHLRTLGAVELRRSEFLTRLAALRDDPVCLPLDRRPVKLLGS